MFHFSLDLFGVQNHTRDKSKEMFFNVEFVSVLCLLVSRIYFFTRTFVV